MAHRPSLTTLEHPTTPAWAPSPPPRRTPLVAALVAVVVAAIAVVAVALVVTTRSHPTPPATLPAVATAAAPAAAPSPTPTSPAAAAPAGAPVATPTTTTPTTAVSGGQGPTPLPAGVDLDATSTDKAALADAYASFAGLTPGDVAGTFPGTVYLGADTTTGTWYAVADIEPSSSFQAAQVTLPPTQRSAAFQDGPYAFERPAGGSWSYVTNLTFTTNCPAFPAPVLQAWGMSPTSCHFADRFSS